MSPESPAPPCPYCNVPCAYCLANAVGPFQKPTEPPVTPGAK